MAGSEVYSKNLVDCLNEYIDIAVFSRIENPFVGKYELEEDVTGDIRRYIVNKPQANYRLQEVYLDPDIDLVFRKILEKEKPDIVHFGHLSHLSAKLPLIAKKEFGIPVVYTLHDFWLFCPRGQMLDEWMQICDTPDEERCLRCLKVKYRSCLTQKVYRSYRRFMSDVIGSIDVFLSPSRFLRDFFISQGVASERVKLSPYGFDKKRIGFRTRIFDKDSEVIFGFIGRVIPSKGVLPMIKAFSSANTERSRLKIFGDAGKFERHLNPGYDHISFHGGFDNLEVGSLLDGIDVLVVPSLWYENSPLVIQEGMLAGIPVITSDIGGMCELITHGINGFTFPVGDIDALCNIISTIDSDPRILNTLKVDPSAVRSIEDDARSALDIYRGLVL